jgi:hydantoinase/carbamoylase family amidase
VINPTAQLEIRGDAIMRDLDALAAFSEPGPGVTRMAWSAELRAANDWLSDRMTELGMSVEVDPAGNLFGRWLIGTGKPVLVGSHLDSVPHGGRFDGPLGVISALHAVAALQAAGIDPVRPIWLVSWTDEEGPRFGTGLLGSRAFAGKDVSGLAERKDASGVTLSEAMRGFGLDYGRITAARAIDAVGDYLELHIEQGPRLQDAGIDIGIVTGVVGLISFDVLLTGQTNHSGTTPMNGRRDAMCAAARIALAIREQALARPGVVANVGAIQVAPGASNVIPGRADLVVEMRAANRKTWESIPEIVRTTVEQAAASEGVQVSCHERHRLEPADFDDRLVAVLEQAAGLEGASATRLFSGAGHDGMSLAAKVPVSMLFVPSVGGVSHSPDEYTEPEACAIGARVLARALGFLTGADERS